jgi:hypothetical protein
MTVTSDFILHLQVFSNFRGGKGISSKMGRETFIDVQGAFSPRQAIVSVYTEVGICILSFAFFLTCPMKINYVLSMKVVRRLEKVLGLILLDLVLFVQVRGDIECNIYVYIG